MASRGLRKTYFFHLKACERKNFDFCVFLPSKTFVMVFEKNFLITLCYSSFYGWTAYDCFKRSEICNLVTSKHLPHLDQWNIVNLIDHFFLQFPMTKLVCRSTMYLNNHDYSGQLIPISKYHGY